MAGMKLSLVAAMILILSVAPAALAQIEVDRKPPTSTTRTFNPSRPPKEMPPLRPGEAAVCESKFLCQVQVEVEITTVEGEKPTCKIAGVKSELRLDVVMWLPTDVTPKIRAHLAARR